MDASCERRCDSDYVLENLLTYRFSEEGTRQEWHEAGFLDG